MSLLSETYATVLQYNNIANTELRLGNPAVVVNGLNYVTIVGKVTPTQVETNYPLLDVNTGKRINLKALGLLLNNVLMESGANDPLVVDPPLSVNFNLVGLLPDLSDYNQFDNAYTDADSINAKFFAEVSDQSTAGNIVIDEYPIVGVRPTDQGSGSIVSGSLVVTLNCVQF